RRAPSLAHRFARGSTDETARPVGWLRQSRHPQPLVHAAERAYRPPSLLACLRASAPNADISAGVQGGPPVALPADRARDFAVKSRVLEESRRALPRLESLLPPCRGGKRGRVRRRGPSGRGAQHTVG